MIRNLTTIRQWGKIYHYFDVPVKRDNWEVLSYAHSRKWRVLNSTQSKPGWETIKCEPLHVKKIDGWEVEVTEPEPKVRMLCGVRFVKPDDGGDDILH